MSLSSGQSYRDSKNDGSIYQKATSVEVCQCPAGYIGTSCEVKNYLISSNQ